MSKKSKYLNNMSLEDWIGIFIILFTFFMVAYYIFVPGKLEFHSDSTDTIMWAKASYDAKKMFNPEFGYACLLPIGINLIMQMFIGITGFSYTTHCIGMFAFLVLFSAAIIAMLKQLNFKLSEISVSYALIIFILSSSKKLREIFWGHTIYYSLGLLFLFAGLAVIFKMLKYIKQRDVSKNYNILFAVICALFMFAAFNGIQAITIFILPAAGGLLGSLIFDFDEKLTSKKSIYIYIVFVTIMLFAGLGMLISNKIAASSEVIAGYESAFSKFGDTDKWIENINKIFRDYLTLIGVDIASGDDLMSIKSIFNILKIFLYIILWIIPVYRIFTYEKIKSEEAKIFFLAHWISTILILIGWVFGKISSANWRLTPILCTSLVFTIIYIKELFEDKRYKRLSVIFIILFSICSIHSMVNIAILDTDFENSSKGKLIRLLEKNDCKYGYGTFWNANVITVLTGEEICVRSIKLDNNEVNKYEYQSEKSWFNKQDGIDEYFLLLTIGEYNDLVRNGNSLIYQSIYSDSNDEYVVLKFDHNIF